MKCKVLITKMIEITKNINSTNADYFHSHEINFNFI